VNLARKTAVAAGAVQPEDELDPLVGREAEAQLFDTVLDRCGRGRPALIEIAGDPGVGKTRLLQEFADRARLTGAPVLADAAAETLLGDLLSQVWWGLSWPIPPATEGSGAHTRRDMFVLLLDDLHAASPRSLSLVSRLLQAAPCGLLMAVAYRPRQATRPMLGALAAATGVRRYLLAPERLTPEAVAAMLGLPAGHATERVHRLSGGVPRYVQAYRPAALAGPVAGLHGLPDELPVGVTAAIQLDLAPLTDEQRMVLEAGSICPDGFDAGLAATLAGLEPSRTADVLDALIAADLLREDAADDATLRFRHEVERAVVYRSLPPGRRRRLHALAAETLSHQGHPVTRYAVHLSRSGRPGDSAAVDALIEAAQSGTVLRVDAIRWLSSARRLLPPVRTTPPVGIAQAGPAERRRARLEFGLAHALVGAGRLREGRSLLEDLARWPEPEEGHAGRVLLARARVERLLGRPFDAHAMLQPALADASRPAAVRVALAADAAVAGVLCGAPEAAAHAELAAELVAELPAEVGLAVTRTAVSVMQVFVAAYVPVDVDLPTTLDRAAAAIDALPDSVLAQHPDLLALLAWAELFHERDRSALRHFDRALEMCCRAGLVALTPWLLAGRSSVNGRLGKLERSRVDSADAELAAQAMGIESMTALARTYRAITLAWQVGPAAAREVAENAVLDASLRRRNWFDGVTQRVAAKLRFHSGDRADSLTALLRACGGESLEWVEAANRPCWASALAEMARKAGRPDEAAKWLAAARDHARPLGLRGQEAVVRTTQARLSLDTSPLCAAEMAAMSAETFADLGWPLEEASARMVRARALCDTRRYPEAEAELIEARRLAEMTGSPPLRRAIAAEQRRALGCAGRVPEAAAVAQGLELTLTRREWDIAQLVAAGVSNAEAAEHLYVTVKTIEAHLTRIFRKTGVSSRAGLAALLAARG
jgi:DNA-binding CsgD family transcriptional regulator